MRATKRWHHRRPDRNPRRSGTLCGSFSVGGFLGMGTKYVVVPFTTLKIVEKKMVLPGGASRQKRHRRRCRHRSFNYHQAATVRLLRWVDCMSKGPRCTGATCAVRATQITLLAFARGPRGTGFHRGDACTNCRSSCACDPRNRMACYTAGTDAGRRWGAGRPVRRVRECVRECGPGAACSSTAFVRLVRCAQEQWRRSRPNRSAR